MVRKREAMCENACLKERDTEREGEREGERRERGGREEGERRERWETYLQGIIHALRCDVFR